MNLGAPNPPRYLGGCFLNGLLTALAALALLAGVVTAGAQTTVLNFDTLGAVQVGTNFQSSGHVTFSLNDVGITQGYPLNTGNWGLDVRTIWVGHTNFDAYRINSTETLTFSPAIKLSTFTIWFGTANSSSGSASMAFQAYSNGVSVYSTNIPMSVTANTWVAPSLSGLSTNIMADSIVWTGTSSGGLNYGVADITYGSSPSARQSRPSPPARPSAAATTRLSP